MNMKINSLIVISLLLVSLFSTTAFAATNTGTSLSASIINQDPDPANAGDIVEVRIGISNQGGGSATNVQVELDPSYPFSLVSGESATQEAGTILGYQGVSGDDMKILKYRLLVDKDATAGTYDLNVKLSEAGSSTILVKTLSLEVESNDNAEIIYIDKTVLIPGKEETLTFTINNVGSTPLRDVKFQWENEDKIILPVGSDNTKYIKYLDVGDSADLTYKVIADTNADAGLYELLLSLSYDDPLSDSTKETSTSAGVYVGGSTDFDIAFSESSGSEYSFTIANIGSNPASSVSVVIPQQDSWSATGSNSMIIGNLNTGDYTVASFSLQSTATRSAPTQQTTTDDTSTTPTPQGVSSALSKNLEIQIVYTDTMGNRNTVEKEIAINQATTTTTGTETFTGGPGQMRNAQQSSSFSTYQWYILGGVLLVMGAIFHRKYKKAKLLDPKLTLKQYVHTLFDKKR